MHYYEDWIEFPPWNSRSCTRFQHQGQPFLDTPSIQHLKVVDVTFKASCIYVIVQATPPFVTMADSLPVTTLLDMYRDLYPELQMIVGEVTWPAPHEILDIVDSMRKGTVVGVSDGSVRVYENRASHAWILQAMNGSVISGKGPVDGSREAWTSHWAELQGQTVMLLS